MHNTLSEAFENIRKSIEPYKLKSQEYRHEKIVNGLKKKEKRLNEKGILFTYSKNEEDSVKNVKKVRKKGKTINQCKICKLNKQGFCLEYQRFASNVRKECVK